MKKIEKAQEATRSKATIKADEITVCGFIGARCKPTLGEYCHASLADIVCGATDPDRLECLKPFFEKKPQWRKEFINAHRTRLEAVDELQTVKACLAQDCGNTAAQGHLEALREKLDELKKDPIAVAFCNAAQFDGIGVDDAAAGDERILLLDVDADAKDAAEATIGELGAQFEADPHIIAYWKSRRGEGWHGVFVTRCGAAHVDAAKRYIINKWPFADQNALKPKHTFFVFPGAVKQCGAIVFEATADEIKACEEKRARCRVISFPSPACSATPTDKQKSAYFEAYLDGLRRDCVNLSHSEMCSIAGRCGGILRECECTHRKRECAKIIHGGCSAGHNTPETLRDILRQIDWGMEHCEATIDWRQSTSQTRQSARPASFPSQAIAAAAAAAGFGGARPTAEAGRPKAGEEKGLQAAIDAMNACKKPLFAKDGSPLLRKDGSPVIGFERGDIAPICAWLKARGVYREMFADGDGLRLADGSELTENALTAEQLKMQEYGLPALGMAAPKLCLQAAKYVGSQNEKDALRQFIDDLPPWDGTDRITEFWQTYVGAKPASEEEARLWLCPVARYMFTVIIGRALATKEKPCKADGAIILEGPQGIGKTSFAKAICANTSWYKTLSLDLPEKEFKMALVATQIAEIGEMGEPTNRQLQAIKRILSSEMISYRKLYTENSPAFPARMFVIATCDQAEILNDGAGARRWLPIRANGVIKDEKDGRLFIDCEGIKRDLRQLYAQGKAIYDECGVTWGEIDHNWQTLQTDQLAARDERMADVLEIMRQNGRTCAKLTEIADWLGYSQDRFDRKAQRDLGRSLRLSGFEKKRAWLDGETQIAWVAPPLKQASEEEGDPLDREFWQK